MLDLLGMADSPLYSAYRWVCSESGARLDFESFAGVVDRLLAAGTVHLRVFDPASATETPLPRVPSGLASRYAELGHHDPRYDPLGLTLSAAARPEPEWSVDVSFDTGQVTVQARPDSIETAIEVARRQWPERRLETTGRSTDGDRMVVTGRFVLDD